MKPSNWLSTLWEILQTLATLTKDVERGNIEIKELREDLHDLTQIVTEIKSELAHQKETTKVVLDSHKNQIDHAAEGAVAKFDVLTTRLDAKIADFEHRLAIVSSTPKNLEILKSGSDDKNEVNAILSE